MTRRSRNLLLILICFAAGGYALVTGLLDVRHAFASANWPSTAGTVLRTHISESRGTGQSRNRIHYKAHVSYRYEVEGNSFTSDQLSFREYSSPDRAVAQEMIDTYPAGVTVEVYYDPDDPSRAVLETGAGLASWLMPAFGGAILLLGLITLLRVLRA